jgi:high-affinity iron transporter
MIENDSQNRFRFRTLLVPVLGILLCGAQAPAPVTDVERAQAQQLVALIDYVAADYPRAVKDGRVLVQSEFVEQKGLLQDAEGIAASLPSAQQGFDAVPSVRTLEQLATRVGSGEEMAAGILALRSELVARYGIATAPTRLPSLGHGRALYVQACAACHGLDGRSETDTAREQNPVPARFVDAERMNKLSPFRGFNAVTFGVKGTSMPAYDVLSESDRWDLATYLFTLRMPAFDAERARAALINAGQSFGPAQLATLTDGDILSRLQPKLAGPEAENALGFLRGEGAYRAPDSGDLAAIRRGFDDAVKRFNSGDTRGGRSLLLATYLDGFEPREPALRARDSERVAEIEDAFVQVRGAMEAGAGPSVIAQRAGRLDALLERAGNAGSSQGAGQVAFWGSLLIVLREGLEAALLVATLLAVLRRSGRSGEARAVHLGWILALGCGVITWFASGKLIAASGARREIVEGLVQLCTAAFLFYASHWLLARAHAQRWVGFLQRQAPGAGGALAVLGLAFMAVFREMFEVVVFYRGLLIETGGQAAMLWLGAGVGAGALMVAVLGFMRVGKKLPLRPFLLTCGLLLCGLSVVMVGHGVRALQEADWLRLTPVGFRSVSLIGLYNSAEGLAAQVALVLALVASAVLARTASSSGSPLPPQTPARSVR